MGQIVCYKARFRPPNSIGYDELYPPVSSPGVEFIVFENTDRERFENGWRILPAAFPADGMTNVRWARKHKILSHRLFPRAEYTLWLDGVFTPKVPIQHIVDSFRGQKIATHRHPHRVCIFEEGHAVITRRKDPNKTQVKEQLQRYLAEGYPRRHGLHETGALLRDNSTEIQTLNELWWSEVCRGSHRDQVSFDYCLWKCRFGTILTLPGTTKQSPYFTWRPHHNHERNRHTPPPRERVPLSERRNQSRLKVHRRERYRLAANPDSRV